MVLKTCVGLDLKVGAIIAAIVQILMYGVCLIFFAFYPDKIKTDHHLISLGEFIAL